ncbi:hypothetical protein F5X99DRAFT_301367 [Biscogniauxia marginata]|nr:hypothetical protein F5X99DRAFT_301367 [Biscogniauxia marginata]
MPFIRKSSVLTKIPILGHILRWDSDDRQTADDGQGLLEDDPLSIPLEDNGQPGRDYTAQRRTLSRNTVWAHFKILVFDGLRRNIPCQLTIAVAVILLVVYLWTRPDLSSVYDGLLPCGNSRYSVNTHTCYNGNFLCPVVEKQRTLRCSNSCYLPQNFSCNDGILEENNSPDSAIKRPPEGSNNVTCPSSYLHLSDPPYQNYFISDCGSTSQVVVTSPTVDGDLELISPRLLIAWPAGNSGIATYFAPKNGVDGSLVISLESSSGTNRTLGTLASGVTGILSLNSSAVLDLAILGSIRTIRDYVEGPGTLVPMIQDAVKIQQLDGGGIQLNRLWLDETTEMFLTFQSTGGNQITIQNGRPLFKKGSYVFKAWYNYPQLRQLNAAEVLNPASQGLITQNKDDTESLAFFSYTSKVLAGGWKFLTYFGRDSLISLLLLEPILSEGEDGVIEAIIGAAIERIDAGDGSVCHEEIIGDYATYMNEQQGKHSTEPQCDYKMVDTDFFLLIVMDRYLVNSATGRSRRNSFLAKHASVLRSNEGLTYDKLASTTAEKIMRLTSAFEKSPVRQNMIHLKQGQTVGQWRDSSQGLGGGRIPYDVNTALVPAALQAIASMSSNGFFASHLDWAETASKRAMFWEEHSLPFFEVTIPTDEAEDLVKSYIDQSGLFSIVGEAKPTSPVTFHGLALEGKNEQSIVKVMNTDDCFRLYLLNATNQTQLSAFLSQAADNVLRPFPLGLSTSVGLLVANPTYAGDSADIRDFTTSSYHGTVVWSWQLAMMAAGLERQLGRCNDEQLAFCADNELYGRVVEAYSHLWDLINQNRDHLSSEVWSWIPKDGGFQYTPLGALPSPKGQGPVESDIRQLWSLAFLAVKKNVAYDLGSPPR